MYLIVCNYFYSISWIGRESQTATCVRYFRRARYELAPLYAPVAPEEGALNGPRPHCLSHLSLSAHSWAVMEWPKTRTLYVIAGNSRAEYTFIE